MIINDLYTKIKAARCSSHINVYEHLIVVHKIKNSRFYSLLRPYGTDCIRKLLYVQENQFVEFVAVNCVRSAYLVQCSNYWYCYFQKSDFISTSTSFRYTNPTTYDVKIVVGALSLQRIPNLLSATLTLDHSLNLINLSVGSMERKHHNSFSFFFFLFVQSLILLGISVRRFCY